MSNEPLISLRKSINEIDKKLLRLFAERRSISLQVAESKYQNAMEIRDQGQEQRLLKQLLSDAKELGLDTSTTLGLFHGIIEDSIRTQYDYFLEKDSATNGTIQLALLGDDTSYSAIAAGNHFSTKSQKYQAKFYNNFQSIFQAVANGDCNYALVPIENTSSGNIPEIHDLILDYQVKVIGEEKLRVKHCLIGLENATLESVREVYSHPQALIQSKEFLNKNSHINTHFRSSTSSALKLVEEYNNPKIAAIASEEAALSSGLQILANGINSFKDNFTRFILISKSSVKVPEKIPAKTSLLLVTKQQAGSLAECLSIISHSNINMTKIESRPITNKPWQERFYIDIEGNLASPEIQEAIHKLEVAASDLDIIGCYPMHDILATNLDISALIDKSSE